MYAVIETGGKQYRVAKDDIIKVERLPGDQGEMPFPIAGSKRTIMPLSSTDT